MVQLATPRRALTESGGRRWYSSTIGKWMSEDPAGLTVDANPQRYVGNSPTYATDPLGLAEVKTTVETQAGRLNILEVPKKDITSLKIYDDPELDKWSDIPALNNIAIRLTADCTCIKEEPQDSWQLRNVVVEFNLFLSRPPGGNVPRDVYGHEFLHIYVMSDLIRSRTKEITDEVDKYLSKHAVYKSKEECEQAKIATLRSLAEKGVWPKIIGGFRHSAQDTGIQPDPKTGNWPTTPPGWSTVYIVPEAKDSAAGGAISDLKKNLESDGKGSWFYPMSEVLVRTRDWPDWSIGGAAPPFQRPRFRGQ